MPLFRLPTRRGRTPFLLAVCAATLAGMLGASDEARAKGFKATPMPEQEIGCFFYGEGDAVLKLHGGYQPDRAGYKGDFGGIQHLIALGSPTERFDERVRAVKISGACAFWMGRLAGSPAEAASAEDRKWLEIDRYRRTARYRRPDVRGLRTAAQYRRYFSEYTVRMSKRQRTTAQWVSCRCDVGAIEAHLAAQTPSAPEAEAATDASAVETAAPAETSEPVAETAAADAAAANPEPAGCWLYDEANQSGRSVFIPAHFGVPDLQALDFNDRTTSVRRTDASPRCRIQLFRDAGYKRRLRRIGSLNQFVKVSDNTVSSAYCGCR